MFPIEYVDAQTQANLKHVKQQNTCAFSEELCEWCVKELISNCHAASKI